MDKKLLVLNLVYAFTDALLGAGAICLFGWCAWNFERWWISLFALVPLILYNTHSVILDSDIRAAVVDKLSPQGGGTNAKT